MFLRYLVHIMIKKSDVFTSQLLFCYVMKSYSLNVSVICYPKELYCEEEVCKQVFKENVNE